MKRKAKPSAAQAMALLRRHARAVERLSKGKPKAAPKPVIKPIQVGHETNGYSLIHKKDREIVLATIRGDKKLVQKLGTLFKVNGSYRIGRARVFELPYE